MWTGRFTGMKKIDFRNSLPFEQQKELAWFYQSFEYREQMFLSELCKTKTLEKVTTMVTRPRLYSIGIVLEDFLKSVHWKQLDLTDPKLRSSYKSVEYDYGKFKLIPYEGAFILQNSQETCVLIIDHYPEDMFKLTLFGSSKQKADKFLTDLVAYTVKHNYMKGKKLRSDLTLLKVAGNCTWNDIVLNAEQQKIITQNVTNFLSIEKKLKDYNIKTKRSIILEGQPGTGKSLLCKILMKELPYTTIVVTPSLVINGVNFEAIYSLASELGPTLLVLEDVDLYAGDREGYGCRDKSILGSLMETLDGIEDFSNVVTIMTTNSLDSIEDAIKKRPGRCDTCITFKFPELAERLKLFRYYVKSIVKGITDDQMETWIKDMPFETLTTDITGAHIKEWIQRAMIKALETNPDRPEVTQKLLEESIEEVKVKSFKPAVGFATTPGPVEVGPGSRHG